MGGEGAGKRERLVTDTVNRWEVLRAGEPCWGECREEVGRGGRGKRTVSRPHWAGLGWSLKSEPLPGSGAVGNPEC